MGESKLTINLTPVAEAFSTGSVAKASHGLKWEIYASPVMQEGKVDAEAVYI